MPPHASSRTALERRPEFLARLLDLMVDVDLKLAPLGSASVSEADPESLEELSRRSVDWWRTTLSQATSVPEIVRAFVDSEPRR